MSYLLIWKVNHFDFIQDVTQRSSSSESKNQNDDELEVPADREFDEQQTRADIVKLMEESLMPSSENTPNLVWIPDGLTITSGDDR